MVKSPKSNVPQVAKFPSSPKYKDKSQVESSSKGQGEAAAGDSDSLSKLSTAVKEGKMEAVQQLLKGISGTQIQAMKDDVYGYTLLHESCIIGDVAMADLLLNKGCDIEALNESGWTPLHVAMIHAQEDMAVFLIEKGCNVNAKDNNGVTPLHRAMSGGDKVMTSLLLSYGADDSATNIIRKRPISIARAYGKTEITDNYESIKVQALSSPKGLLKIKKGEEEKQRSERERERRQAQEAADRIKALELEVQSLQHTLGLIGSDKFVLKSDMEALEKLYQDQLAALSSSAQAQAESVRVSASLPAVKSTGSDSSNVEKMELSNIAIDVVLKQYLVQKATIYKSKLQQALGFDAVTDVLYNSATSLSQTVVSSSAITMLQNVSFFELLPSSLHIHNTTAVTMAVQHMVHYASTSFQSSAKSAYAWTEESASSLLDDIQNAILVPIKKPEELGVTAFLRGPYNTVADKVRSFEVQVYSIPSAVLKFYAEVQSKALDHLRLLERVILVPMSEKERMDCSTIRPVLAD